MAPRDDDAPGGEDAPAGDDAAGEDAVHDDVESEAGDDD
jgi:hypothetical protein